MSVTVLAHVAVMAVNLYDYQQVAIDKLKSGSILCGGVGSGKSRTSIAYFFLNICQGQIKINGIGDFAEMKTPRDLYIITTAKKRDSLEWEGECIPFMISTKPELSLSGIKVTVDSWNNISKYKNIYGAFFIFDEQRLVGSGAWVKSFLKIAKKNKWILLSATPGDTWTDYIPVFVANGFYKNRSEFLREHAVYSRFAKYPKIEKFIETNKLMRLRDSITVIMHYHRSTITHDEIIPVSFDKELYKRASVDRWDVYNNKPVTSIGPLCYIMRKVVNSHPSRLKEVIKLIKKHPKVIIFYNFDYELETLMTLGPKLGIPVNQWNGHKHEPVPDGKSWIYLVQYTAGAEGWNCIKTDTTIFYSQNYSYKIMIQSAGRIDRLNTPFKDLYYYHLRSNATIDIAIAKALKMKKDFNMNKFINDRV